MVFSVLRSAGHEPPIPIRQTGLSLRLRIPPEAAGGTPTWLETTKAPGFGPRLHRHREADGRRFAADAGDAVVAPGGSAVAVFLGLGEVMCDGGLDQAALNAFGARWQVEFLGPQPRADGR